MTTYSPEMRERALRMLAEAAPDHPRTAGPRSAMSLACSE